jgi:hypothetical protein
MRILRSYPSMLPDKAQLPPFIHHLKYRDLVEGDTTCSLRVHPLDSAMRLSSMLLEHRRSDKSFVWRLIGMEQERLLYEVRSVLQSNTSTFVLPSVSNPSPHATKNGS